MQGWRRGGEEAGVNLRACLKCKANEQCTVAYGAQTTIHYFIYMLLPQHNFSLKHKVLYLYKIIFFIRWIFSLKKIFKEIYINFFILAHQMYCTLYIYKFDPHRERVEISTFYMRVMMSIDFFTYINKRYIFIYIILISYNIFFFMKQ